MINGSQSALDMLIAERDRLNEAIAVLQGGAASAAPKRRGRPLGSKNKKAATAHAGRMSAVARKATSERMKKYWAQRRKERAARSL